MKLYGLIGYPLSHSFSKKYFTGKFEKENITDCSFELFPIEHINDLPQLIKNNPALCGLSVTIPYKESVIPYLDELDETAKAVGAVNCIKVMKKGPLPTSPEGRGSNTQNLGGVFLRGGSLPLWGDWEGLLIGYNTDVYGFRQSIKPFLESHHQRALILGTGGASKAVAYVLKEIGIDCYFVSREKKQESRNNIFIYDELNEYIINSFKLIVNTTPVGMFPKTTEMPELPYQFITPSHLLYDLVYNPLETEFLKQGKQKGAICINGLSMLHQQAEKAWEIWNK